MNEKYAKLEIKGTLVLKSGLHIGASDAFAAIGATDSPVIKDPLTGRPVIPGSSIKGKMRTLLARALNTEVAGEANKDNDQIKRLFGSSDKQNAFRSRLVFTDLVMTDDEAKRLVGRAKSTTEVKFENTINRVTAVPDPRQIERVVAGAEFPFSLIYEIGPVTGVGAGNTGEVQFPEDTEIIDDFEIITEGLRLLSYDYLGGSGTRGYGRVAFKEMEANVVVGQVNEEVLSSLTNKLSGE